MYEIVFSKYRMEFTVTGASEGFATRDEAEFYYAVNYEDNTIKNYKDYTIHYTNDYKTVDRVEVHKHVS